MQNEQVLTKDIFCAAEQTTTPHQGSVDGNGEFVFTCLTEGCGRFVKFPADTTPEAFEALVATHEVTNSGQVDISKQQDKLKALLGVSLQNTEPTPGTNEEVAADPAPQV